MAKNKKAPARHKAEDDYLLTTKLFCGYCGAYLCGESGTIRTGVVHHYYKCVSVKKKRTDCHKKPVRKEWLEDMVVNATMKMLMNNATIDAIVSALMILQDEENVHLPLYEKQLRETKTAIDNLLNAIQQGLLTRSTKERLDALEAAQDELENKIACEKLAKPRITEEQFRFFLEKFRKMDVANQAQRKMLIDTFVNAIFLYDDKVVLTYNFHEGAETISFEELQKVTEAGASGSDLVSSTAPKKKLGKSVGLLFCKSGNGLEEAAMNQAPVGLENGADRAATSRENPVPSTAPNQYNPNQIFQIGNGFGFFLIFLSQRYNPLDLASRVSV